MSSDYSLTVLLKLEEAQALTAKGKRLCFSRKVNERYSVVWWSGLISESNFFSWTDSFELFAINGFYDGEVVTPSDSIGIAKGQILTINQDWSVSVTKNPDQKLQEKIQVQALQGPFWAGLSSPLIVGAPPPMANDPLPQTIPSTPVTDLQRTMIGIPLDPMHVAPPSLSIVTTATVKIPLRPVPSSTTAEVPLRSVPSSTMVTSSQSELLLDSTAAESITILPLDDTPPSMPKTDVLERVMREDTDLATPSMPNPTTISTSTAQSLDSTISAPSPMPIMKGTSAVPPSSPIESRPSTPTTPSKRRTPSPWHQASRSTTPSHMSQPSRVASPTRIIRDPPTATAARLRNPAGFASRKSMSGDLKKFRFGSMSSSKPVDDILSESTPNQQASIPSEVTTQLADITTSEITAEPESIIESVDISEPEVTLESAVTPKPGVIPEATVTLEPEVVHKPATNLEPEVVLEPENTLSQDLVLEPAATLEPDVVVEPAVTPKLEPDRELNGVPEPQPISASDPPSEPLSPTLVTIPFTPFYTGRYGTTNHSTSYLVPSPKVMVWIGDQTMQNGTMFTKALNVAEVDLSKTPVATIGYNSKSARWLKGSLTGAVLKYVDWQDRDLVPATVPK